MNLHKNIDKYCELVCEQIRWKRVRGNIELELRQHIEDQSESYIEEGVNEENAINRAVIEMGDAVDVGSRLDRVHRPKAQWALIMYAIVIVMIGFIIREITYLQLGYHGISPIDYVALIMGVSLMIGAYFLDVSFVGKYSKHIFMIVLILSIILILTSENYKGEQFIRFVHISCSYLMLIYPLAVVALVYSLRDKGYKGIILSWIGVIVFMVILMQIPASFETVQLGIIALIIIMISVYKKWFAVNRILGMLLSVSPIFLISLAFRIFTFNQSYIVERSKYLLSFNYSAPILFDGTYLGATRSLIQNSVMMGQGTLTKDNVAFKFITSYELPDSLITAFIYNFGWLPFLGIMIFIGGFIFWSLIISLKQKSVLGLFTSVAIILTLSFQAIGYITFNLGFQPFVPMALPLISPGNTALVINLMLIGLMLSVFRNGDEVKDKNVTTKNVRYFSENR